MAIAFFDLDLTLLGKNSGSLWVRHELRAGRISRWQGIRAASWIIQYQLGLAKMEDALLQAIAALEGDEEATVRARTHAFYDNEIRGLYRPGGLGAIQAHREAGDLCVLLTASSNYISEKVAEDLALDGFLCNRFAVDADGVFTGKPVGDICYGAGKVTHAEAFAESRGTTLEACAFYTDSFTDLPMMLAASRPVAVHPDPRLKREAKTRGWTIEDWGSELVSPREG